MKILCDACNAEEASVFCCADEASLCGGCDRRVHRANKLASKHRRFSLHHPSSPALSPRCDVCQEKRAFLFCQEDRAILCRDCDAPIHTANELTRKHNRFLLTGVKLSSSAEEYDATAVISTSEEKRESKTKEEEEGEEKNETKKNSHVPEPDSSTVVNYKTAGKEDGVCSSSSGSSSISEYLIKVLPGWHVEDLLLDSASPAPALFYQPADEMAPFLEADLDTGFMSAASEETPIWWVPKVPQVSPLDLMANQGFGIGKGGYSYANEVSRQRRSRDDGFTVPEINHPPSNKRFRPSKYI